jgi:hypothetical protein
MGHLIVQFLTALSVRPRWARTLNRFVHDQFGDGDTGTSTTSSPGKAEVPSRSTSHGGFDSSGVLICHQWQVGSKATHCSCRGIDQKLEGNRAVTLV